jgi:pyrroloquinoline-quinone synthase
MDWNNVDAAVEEKSLLKHPFYQAWSAGELTLEDLRYYAGQYFHLESLFPRLLSRVHSATEDTQMRKVLRENLNDEEAGDDNHRELWLRFADSIGADRNEIEAGRPNAKTQQAMEQLKKLAANENPAVGLGALYGYESQQPKVAETKISGLQAFYGINDERGLSFFKTHQEMDKWHAAQEKEALERSGADTAVVSTAAAQACDALNTFLDGVDEATRQKRGACASC